MTNVITLFEKDEPTIGRVDGYVTFINDGVLNIRAIKTMGMSAKDNKNAIGYFGTGMKYAIAILLRNHQTITICAGVDKYEFSTKKIGFRGEEFELVTMNGEELGFTTELGKNWQIWQAYRELHCNCLDEYGQVSISYGEPEPQDGKTIIYCSGGDVFKAYEERSTIILSSIPRLVSAQVEVHNGASHEVFYRNIRALRTRYCLFTYNILSAIELTEDRTIKYTFYARGKIMNCVLQSLDKKFIEEVLMAPEDSFEGTFNFVDNSEATATPSKEFLDVAAKLSTKGKGNASASAVYRKYVSFSDAPAKEAKLTKNQQVMFDKALNFCDKLGYDISKYSVIITHELAHDVLGIARDGKIFINIRAFQKGLREISATLIEEFIHLDTGMEDESRQLQNYLLERLVDLGAELYQLGM